MAMIKGCKLPTYLQTRAEKYLEGVGAWRSIPKQSEPVIELGTLFKDRSSLAAFAAMCAKWWADICTQSPWQCAEVHVTYEYTRTPPTPLRFACRKLIFG
eukprot:COSAG01_NODE_1070_length_11869_cov_21.371368_8_plen_100_part_00